MHTQCRTFMYFVLLVFCFQLTYPINGAITCLLGDDGVPSYEDTCNFTCNTGYELTGSDTRTCQSDGSWSGSEAMCTGNLQKCSACFSVLMVNFFFHK